MVKRMKKQWILRTMNEKLTNKQWKNSEKYEKAMKNGEKYEKAMKKYWKIWKNWQISNEKIVKNMKRRWKNTEKYEKSMKKWWKIWKSDEDGEKYEKAMKMVRGNYFVTFKIFILDVR